VALPSRGGELTWAGPAGKGSLTAGKATLDMPASGVAVINSGK
jgi:hypothetical protein